MARASLETWDYDNQKLLLEKARILKFDVLADLNCFFGPKLSSKIIQCCCSILESSSR